MDSMIDYVKAEQQRDLLNRLLKEFFINVPEYDYEDLTEAVLSKMIYLDSVRSKLHKLSGNELKKAAEDYNISIDTALDSVMFFIVLIENVMLYNRIKTGDQDE